MKGAFPTKYAIKGKGGETMKKTGFFAILIALIFSAGIAIAQPASQIGLFNGALGGALIGQAIGRNTESTLIGTAVGGLVGYVIGSEVDRGHMAPVQYQSVTYYGRYDYRHARPYRHDYRYGHHRGGYYGHGYRAYGHHGHGYGHYGGRDYYHGSGYGHYGGRGYYHGGGYYGPSFQGGVRIIIR